MQVEIITPEAVIYKGEADVVSLPGTEGKFQILKNHAPIVSLLEKGEVRIKGNVILNKENEKFFSKKGDDYCLSIVSGTVEMSRNKVVVLVD